jgi:hypothetical protein
MYGRWAQGLLVIAGIVAVATLMGHSLTIMLWRAYPGTAKRPLPAFLTFPAPELVVANMLLLPLATASTVLFFQTSSNGRLALGALGWLLLLGYLALVTSVVLALASSGGALGLRFARHADRPDASFIDGQLPKATALLLQRLAPHHLKGYWDTPGLEVQQQLRLGSLGGAHLHSRHSGHRGRR